MRRLLASPNQAFRLDFFSFCFGYSCGTPSAVLDVLFLTKNVFLASLVFGAASDDRMNLESALCLRSIVKLPYDPPFLIVHNCVQSCCFSFC